jgi:hypothetical protein
MGAPKVSADNTFLWIFFGGVAGLGLWLLLKPKAKPGETQAADMPEGLPSEFQSVGAVATALDDLKTLYRSGRLNPEQALGEISRLSGTLTSLQQQGVGDSASAQEVFRQLANLEADVREFMQMSVPA